MKNNDKEKQNRLSGRYEIIEQVGIGGMSCVYKAYDSKRKKIVAIKVLKDELSLDPEFVAKFKSEALSCKEIRHENVISAYDVVDEENLHYIVMEYVEGTTLNKYIKEKGKLSNEETVKISLQVAKGIQAAHKKGIIHRDIKPQNIVIDEKNIAKITDFGIARAITSTTRNISVVGTVHYISPEQVRNTVVDFRSDIYSFGCTMYEMITGIVPFSGDTPLAIIISHLRENIKAPHLDNPNIYKSLEKIILKSTRMIPRERYQGMEEMIADLEMALKDKEGTYISDSIYDDDEEGKTVIINDEDMKVIKAVSQKFSNVATYKNEPEDLTPEQKEFFDRYIKNGAFKQHMLMRKLIIGAIACVAILAIVTIVITLDTRKPTIINIATSSTSDVYGSFRNSLSGIDISLAEKLANDYGIKINIVGKEDSETIEYGKIIRVADDKIDFDKSIDVIISNGGEVIDFTDKEKLNNTKWDDMRERLNEKGLKYSVSEIRDQNVPRGYIIGVNKKNSKESGEIVFTISKGISDNIHVMPKLIGKPISEVRELLAANEMVLGNISFVRNEDIEENSVITQSVPEGTEAKSGTTIDLVLSCGKDGIEYIAEAKEKWYGELTSTYRVVKEKKPNSVEKESDTMIIQVRLVQATSEGVIYTELIEPKEYKVGTVIPLVFTKIEGEAKVQNGQVQVVDVENDKVLSSIDITFWPKKG